MKCQTYPIFSSNKLCLLIHCQFRENLLKVAISQKINQIKPKFSLKSGVMDEIHKIMGTEWGNVWYFLRYWRFGVRGLNHVL